MARSLAKSTTNRLRKHLEGERQRLTALIEELERDREEARLTETSSEHSADPTSTEGASMAFEYEKELSIVNNAKDLLDKVNHALERMERGQYGTCEICGQPIPAARLQALPYATLCVTCASRR